MFCEEARAAWCSCEGKAKAARVMRPEAGIALNYYGRSTMGLRSR